MSACKPTCLNPRCRKNHEVRHCKVQYDFPMRMNARGRAVSTRRGRPLHCARPAFAQGLCKMHLRAEARAARSSAERDLRVAEKIEALLVRA